MSEEKTARIPVSDTEPCEGMQASPSTPTSQPRKAQDDQRISVRVLAAEKAQLVALAELRDTSVSELLRDALGLVQRPKRTLRPPPKVDRKLLIAVNAVGTNCNQIARAINSARRHGDMRQLDAIDILTTLVSLDRQLASIRLSHSNMEEDNAD